MVMSCIVKALCNVLLARIFIGNNLVMLGAGVD